MKLQTILNTLGLITILLLAGTTSAIHPHATSDSITKHLIHLTFSTPTITTTQDSTIIHLPECTTQLHITDAPILPTYIHTIEYPLGTTIQEISISTSTQTFQTLPTTISPSPPPLVSTNQPIPSGYIQPNPQIYTNDAYYPDTWYTYKQTGGLNTDNEHVTIITLQIIPVRYNPVTQTILSINDITLEITTNNQNIKRHIIYKQKSCPSAKFMMEPIS